MSRVEEGPSARGKFDIRERVIHAVQTPLGLFTLVVLVVEAMLGAVAVVSPEPSRPTMFYAMLGFLGLLVLAVVARPSVFRPSPAQTIVLGPDGKSGSTVAGRQRALVGTWVGTLEQDLHGKPITRPLRLVLDEGQGVISGTLSVEHPEGPAKPDVRLKIIAAVIFDSYVKFDYKNVSDLVLQFGSYVAHLDALGTKLTGRFAGYGSINGAVVSGVMTFNKTE